MTMKLACARLEFPAAELEMISGQMNIRSEHMVASVITSREAMPLLIVRHAFGDLPIGEFKSVVSEALNESPVMGRNRDRRTLVPKALQ